jgi:peptide/nickel transport system substrate-binding protein
MLGVLALLAPLLGGCLTTPGAPTRIVYGVASEPRVLNPLLANDGASMSVQQLLFEPLVRPDAQTGVPVPALAERWEASPDGLGYTFYLRPNVTWSDGQPFTADDVTFTLDTVLDPRTKTPLRGLLDPVASYDTPDAHTFHLSLKKPFCPFLSGLAQIQIVPKHVLANSSDINTDPFNNRGPVGTGPYVLKEWITNDHITLTANPNYWAGRPRIDQWIRKTVQSDTVLTSQLKTGEIDYAALLPHSVAEMQRVSNVSILSYAGPLAVVIEYNLDRPLFQDKRVRQALTHALNREQMVQELLFGQGQVLDSPIVAHAWAYNANVPSFGYDPDKARALLAEAGWTPGTDGMLKKDGQPLRFTLLTNAGNTDRLALLTIAQDQWAKLGVRADTQSLEFAAFNDKFQRAHDFDAVVTSLTQTIDPDQSTYWAASSFPGGANYVHYANRAVESLLEQARTVGGCDQAARKALYDQIQTLIAEDQPFTFLWSAKTTIAVNKRVQNVTPHLWLGSGAVVWNLKDWSLSR